MCCGPKYIFVRVRVYEMAERCYIIVPLSLLTVLDLIVLNRFWILSSQRNYSTLTGAPLNTIFAQ